MSMVAVSREHLENAIGALRELGYGGYADDLESSTSRMQVRGWLVTGSNVYADVAVSSEEWADRRIADRGANTNSVKVPLYAIEKCPSPAAATTE